MILINPQLGAPMSAQPFNVVHGVPVFHPSCRGLAQVLATRSSDDNHSVSERQGNSLATNSTLATIPESIVMIEVFSAILFCS